MAKNSIRVREIPILLLSAKKEKIYKLEIILLAFKIETSRLESAPKIRLKIKDRRQNYDDCRPTIVDGQSKFP